MFLRHKAAAVMSNINVIPMADVMLVLLIIFMVVTPMLGPGVPVDLARVQNPIDYDTTDDAIFVTVTRDGAVYVGQERTTEDGAAEHVKRLLANRRDRAVFIKSDARARYGRVVAVVDAVRAAGVEHVGLLTERARPLQNGGQRWE